MAPVECAIDGPLADSAALFDMPTDEAALLRHYTLSGDVIEHVWARGHNRLAFALQLCAFRFTPWVGPHPTHQRIPVAKAALAYDSAPYRR